jgi:hypothetical protein
MGGKGTQQKGGRWAEPEANKKGAPGNQCITWDTLYHTCAGGGCAGWCGRGTHEHGCLKLLLLHLLLLWGVDPVLDGGLLEEKGRNHVNLSKGIQ